MSKKEKLFIKILNKNQRENITFKELEKILEWLHFTLRHTTGSHQIYRALNIPEQVNIQAGKNGKAKPYQVDQIRETITKYKLTI